MSALQFRLAELSDADMLQAWQQQPFLQQALGDDDWQWHTELSKRPAWREQLIAELDGQPIGFMEIIDPALEESHYWGACEPNLRALDIWIGIPALLGQGYGTQMMAIALARCFADKSVKGVLLDPLASNTKAHRFYEKLGFEFQTQRTFDDDVCYVYYLSRANYEKSRL